MHISFSLVCMNIKTDFCLHNFYSNIWFRPEYTILSVYKPDKVSHVWSSFFVYAELFSVFLIFSLTWFFNSSFVPMSIDCLSDWVIFEQFLPSIIQLTGLLNEELSCPLCLLLKNSCSLILKDLHGDWI